MFDCYLVWGNPRDFNNRRVYYRSLHRNAVTISPEGNLLSLDVGPVPLVGPIIHSEPAGVDPHNASALSILIDTEVPTWVEENFMTTLGWEAVDRLPKPSRYPFQVDILLLAPNWAGSFDGWSSTQWLDVSVKPLQRIPLTLATDVPLDPVTVHVLDVGTDVHGIGYAVVFAPDRDVVNGFQVTRHGWRREPVARLRRQTWAELADLSMQMEIMVVPVFGSAVVADVLIHEDSQFINRDAIDHLPDDVYQVVSERLSELGGPDSASR